MADDGLVAALARCQAKFPPIVKSHTNPAFKGSQYADVADVLAAVRPVLAAEGIVVSQSTDVTDEGVVLITALLHGNEARTEQRIESRFPLHIGNLNAQGVGSLMTYHRRYQLCAILGVHPVGDDDDGNLAAVSQTVVAKRPFPETATVLTEDGRRIIVEKSGAPLPLPSVPLTQPEKPIAAMTVAELISFARENGVTVSGSKSDMIRTLQPLVLAATGAEPFETDAPPVTPVDPETRPFEPVTHATNPEPSVADAFRHLPPKVRDSVRRAE